ncbi:MAG TPA: iron-sulfur cluster assembly protein [Burkholderiaceae bacterium]|nr:iron-sulfur cluster assembly protein [Burkholderiaceae bacterium]HMZ02401.1 iron-sulfur cluster assembly protein [Burkholderiaceae bacterium]HNB45781.1 iron-sulfur cluster assembly protein [Burkholderiaceae bacterium]HNG78080.1 iron-sulfur cluster assembly protein [Burkholderiaceae bacterium]
MPPNRPAIWIQPAQPAQAAATAPLPPRLSGPAPLIERVMARLAQLRDPASGVDLLQGGRVVALEIDADEATLTLRIGSGDCDTAHHVAEEAFDILRAELPGRDLFLQHVQATPCAPAPDTPL